MFQVMADVLPAAVAIGLSPIPVTAVVLVLVSDRSRTNGIAFAAGWLAGLLVLTGAFVLLVSGAADRGEEVRPTVAAVKLLVGLTFLVVAVRKSWRHVFADAPSEPPAWMASVATFSPPRALGLGAGLAALNPKNLAITATAAGTIAAAELTDRATVGALLVYVGLASVIVVVAVGAHLVAPRRSATALAMLQRVMSDYGSIILVVVLLVLGAQLVGSGLGGLQAWIDRS